MSDACIVAALSEGRCSVVSTPASYSVDLGFIAPSGERGLSFKTFMELPGWNLHLDNGCYLLQPFEILVHAVVLTFCAVYSDVSFWNCPKKYKD